MTPRLDACTLPSAAAAPSTVHRVAWKTVLRRLMALTATWGAVNASLWHPGWGFFAWVLFLLVLLDLRHCPTPRSAFWWGTSAGYGLLVVPMGFVWTLFGWEWRGWTFSVLAPVLWLVVAAWTGLVVVVFRALQQGTPGSRIGLGWAPVAWAGFEYLRCEWSPLRFSWITPGSSVVDAPAAFLLDWLRTWGVYGTGALMLLAALTLDACLRRDGRRAARAAGMLAVATGIALGRGAWEQRRDGGDGPRPGAPETPAEVRVVALQIEMPGPTELRLALEDVPRRHPNAEVLLLGEYTLMEPPGESVRRWCREHGRWLVVGGVEPVGGDTTGAAAFHNTAFVINPAGDVVFRQAKSRPIPFFRDGLPARGRSVWASPWGPLGLAVCYDFSFRRVTDAWVRGGARALWVVAMDATEWGEMAHRLNARVTRLRAVEHGLPVFRVATSGYSQWVDAGGVERATLPFPGQGESMEVVFALSKTPGRVPWDRWLGPIAALATLTACLLCAARSVRFNRPGP